MSGVAGREALVDALRQLIEDVVVADLPDRDAARLAEDVVLLRERVPVEPSSVPWYRRDLPDEERDGSAGWLRHNPITPPVGFTVAGEELRGSVRFGVPFTGPRDRAHGGYLAATLDHVLGMFLADIGIYVLTLSLEVTYPAPTPLHTDLEVAAGLMSNDGRKPRAWAEIRHEGLPTARAEGLFLKYEPVLPTTPVVPAVEGAPA